MTNGIAGVVGWACVNENGEVENGSPNLAVSHPEVGEYLVTFIDESPGAAACLVTRREGLALPMVPPIELKSDWDPNGPHAWVSINDCDGPHDAAFTIVIVA